MQHACTQHGAQTWQTCRGDYGAPKEGFDCWSLFPDFEAKKESARDSCPRWLQRVRASPARAGLGAYACEHALLPSGSRAIGPNGWCNGLRLPEPERCEPREDGQLPAENGAVVCQSARHDPSSVHARPSGVLEAHQSPTNLSHRPGPGPGSQQPPGTARNPKLTLPPPFPCAEPVSLPEP
jgi:hypothetical protein